MAGASAALEFQDLPPPPVPTSSTTYRLKPSRLCVVVVVVVVTLGLIVYHYSSASDSSSTTTSPGGPRGQVRILMDERHPYNITITSDMDIIQSLDVHGTKVQISVKDLLDNKTSGPLRITRSNGEEFNVSLLYEGRPRGCHLTDLDQIVPSINNIFFIETRCGTAKQVAQYSADSGVVLNARQICAVESTARLHPSRPIYLLHTCPLDNHFCEKSPKFVQELMTYPNVHVVQLKMAEFFLRTTVEELYFGGRFEESVHPIEHVSDVVRLLTLWKFGGTYMDIDVVSIRSLDGLGTNFAGWQDEMTVASGVLNFEPSGFGHQVLTECLEELRVNFEPFSWSTNGPILVTNTLTRLCGIGTLGGCHTMFSGFQKQNHCSEFTAYPIPVFYPLYYTEWRQFFEERSAKRTLNRLNDTYVVHIWNKMSSRGVIQVGGGQAYGLLADNYCPKVYWNCGPTF